MNIDDVLYVSCLLSCIGLGNVIKNVNNPTKQKVLSTAFGVLMICIVSGWHILHCFISLILGALTILNFHPSVCHLATFLAMFGYLAFFRLTHLVGLPDPPAHTNMIQMMLTLKVAGIAFERNASWKRLKKREQQLLLKTYETVEEISDYDLDLQSLEIVEIFHYSMNYIGVLTGPYYRYRTYRDYFATPFKNYAPNVKITTEKLKYCALFGGLYLISNSLWPLEYALSDVFYDERSWIYRLMYIWPTFFIFRMRMYTGLTLSECVCTMAGFGAYPDEADVNNGEGPKKPYLHLSKNADKLTYNFRTIVNTRVKDVETCWTFREGMKHWNICVQYWLAVNVYKLFPSKSYRAGVTFLCSAYWHGFRPGHYFCIMGAPFYAALEDTWNTLIRKDATGTSRKIIDVIFWIAKFFAFSYLGTAFLLVSFSHIWRFYSSVYHIGYLFWAAMMTLGVFLKRQKTRRT